MPYYYVDLEVYSTGEKPDPATDKVIGALVCAIDEATGKPVQEPLVLLGEDEAEIVRTVLGRMDPRHPFDFIPVGFNVLFDLWFLKEKAMQYLHVDLGDRFYLERPYLDFKHVMVFHAGHFKGVRLGAPGNPVADWWKYNDLESIERYMREKFTTFCDEWGRLRAADT